MTEPEHAHAARPGFFAKHRFAVIISAMAVVFLLLASGAVAAGYSVGASKPLAAAALPPEEDPARVVPDAVPEPTAVRTCSVAAPAADPDLGTLRGAVVNSDNREVLFARATDEPTGVGSVFGLLTATAAITSLGSDHQLSTRVMDGGVPGSIVLVGGGDATLSQLPVGEPSVYPGAPTLSDLASQTRAAYDEAHPDVPITEVVVDAGYWDRADRWNPTWDRRLQTEGFLSEVTALQVDGDRADPRAAVSPRSTEPVTRAGAAFAAELGLAGVTIREGSADSGAPVLGEVRSAPVEELVAQMLASNDATLAEMLARAVSLEANLGGSAGSLQQAIPQALQEQGLDTGSLTISDGSGTSSDTTASAAFLTQLMITISTEVDLKPVLDALPVPGTPGALETRLAGDEAAAAAVSAVTGASDGLRSIAGLMTAADGTRFSFAMVGAGDAVTDAAASALDALTIAIYSCGNNLSNG